MNCGKVFLLSALLASFTLSQNTTSATSQDCQVLYNWIGSYSDISVSDCCFSPFTIFNRTASITCNSEDRITSIQFASTGLGETIPPLLGSLTQLETIDLSGNRLLGTIPPEIGNLLNLFSIKLSKNLLSGSLPESFSSLTSLRLVDLSNNQLSGDVPPLPMPLMEVLIMSVNQFTSLPSFGLESMARLRVLSFRDNQITGPLPSALSVLQNLEYLYFSDNKFNGEIVDLSSLVHIRHIELQKNYLSGSIPKGFQNLQRLEVLLLQKNSLSGGIPSELGSLSRLRRLYLDSNKLTGSIPSSLSNCVKLRRLSLYSNLLSGSIPEEMGKLQQLQVLYLHANLLEGQIPQSMIDLPKLKTLHIADNLFAGPLPDFQYSKLGNDGCEVITRILDSCCNFRNLGPGVCKVVGTSLVPDGCLVDAIPICTGKEGIQSGSSTSAEIISGAVGGSIAFLVLVGCICWCLRYKRKSKRKRESFNPFDSLPLSFQTGNTGTLPRSSGTLPSDNMAENVAVDEAPVDEIGITIGNAPPRYEACVYPVAADHAVKSNTVDQSCSGAPRDPDTTVESQSSVPNNVSVNDNNTNAPSSSCDSAEPVSNIHSSETAKALPVERVLSQKKKDTLFKAYKSGLLTEEEYRQKLDFVDQ